MEVLKHIPKQRVFTELDHEPTDEEILKAVLGAWAQLQRTGRLRCGSSRVEDAAMADDHTSHTPTTHHTTHPLSHPHSPRRHLEPEDDTAQAEG
jgi:hypothetical protein